MHLLILYATTEGQTRKIARFSARRLVGQGASVELLPLDDADEVTLDTYDGILLMASVHAGQYQAALTDFATTHREALAAVPHAFLSVSLSAAGDDPEDWEGLKTVVAGMTKATGWTPQQVLHVAGAFRFSQYNWFKTWAMRWIASQKDPNATPGNDVEYTDWDALAAFLDDWRSKRLSTDPGSGS